jgi:hypothetical protein
LSLLGLQFAADDGKVRDGTFGFIPYDPGTKQEARRLSRNIGERRTRCPSLPHSEKTGRLRKAIDKTLSLALKGGRGER